MYSVGFGVSDFFGLIVNTVFPLSPQMLLVNMHIIIRCSWESEGQLIFIWQMLPGQLCRGDSYLTQTCIIVFVCAVLSLPSSKELAQGGVYYSPSLFYPQNHPVK